LEIEGKSYPLRRLGVLDVDRLLGIAKRISQFVDRKVMGDIGKFTAEQAGSFLIDYLPDAFDEILTFLGSLIGLDPGLSEEVVEHKRKKSKAAEFKDPNIGTMRDPETFPLDALPALIAKLTEHRNVVDFFTAKDAMVSGLRRLFGGLKESSTESKPATDGPTSTSPEDD